MIEKEKQINEEGKEKISLFLGKLESFNIALKLYHWKISGVASFAQHVALDQALVELRNYTGSIAEISYAIYGNLKIKIPETECPGRIIELVKEQIQYIDSSRHLYSKIFIQSILDDFQKTLGQLMYRLKRLS